MIIQALADYYQRLEKDPNIDIAPFGFEQKAIGFLIELDQYGKFINLRDIREGIGRKRKGRNTLVPKAVKRASGIAANLLWDTAPYVLGVALPAKGKNMEKLAERAVSQHIAFTLNITQTFEEVDDKGINAVEFFLKNMHIDSVLEHSLWEEVEKDGGNISFILEGDRQLICQRPNVVATIIKHAVPTGWPQLCLISGQNDIPARLHTAIKNVWGAQSSGANIVSFNLDAFRSFGKKQGLNAPVGQRVEFAYTTALNYLLSSEKQRMQVGDASTVFWAKNTCDFESDFLAFLAPKKGEEAVCFEKIRGLLSAVKSGVSIKETENIPFYVLGLAPNASRISIRFWVEGNVKELKEKIAEHFYDIAIIRSPRDPEYLSLFQLLCSTAMGQKSENVPPHLGGDVARAVLSGTPYPRSLFANAVLRNKAEQRVSFARASIIKGFLARNSRLNKSNKQEVTMKLDTAYDNVGYVLGRLFAILERIQEQAQGMRLNKTIRDTYFGAATSSPLVTFNRLNQLVIHHLAKIRNSGKNTVWFDKLLGEVNVLLPKEGIPSILSLEDQGRFSIGYYQQRQSFFVKKEKKTEGENT